MSPTAAGPANVISVATGVESTDRAAPVRDARHEALAFLIGNWINDGHTIATAAAPPAPIRTQRCVLSSPATSPAPTARAGPPR
jgi:hypothetical protein